MSDPVSFQGDMSALVKALVKAQAEIQPAAKDRLNPHFNRVYTTLTSLWDAIREPLTSNGIAVVQRPRTDGNLVFVETLLLHVGGGCLSTECSAVARDASPQAVGSVITYLRRYGLAAMVGVVSDEDDDATAGQAANVEHKPAQRQEPAHKRNGTVAPDKPATAGQVDLLRRMIQSHVFNPSERAVVEGLLDRGLSFDKATDLIDRVKTTLETRKAAEKADAAMSEREPGSDDE